jgi:hypothetical protein
MEDKWSFIPPSFQERQRQLGRHLDPSGKRSRTVVGVSPPANRVVYLGNTSPLLEYLSRATLLMRVHSHPTIHSYFCHDIPHSHQFHNSARTHCKASANYCVTVASQLQVFTVLDGDHGNVLAGHGGAATVQMVGILTIDTIPPLW